MRIVNTIQSIGYLRSPIFLPIYTVFFQHFFNNSEYPRVSVTWAGCPPVVHCPVSRRGLAPTSCNGVAGFSWCFQRAEVLGLNHRRNLFRQDVHVVVTGGTGDAGEENIWSAGGLFFFSTFQRQPFFVWHWFWSYGVGYRFKDGSHNRMHIRTSTCRPRWRRSVCLLVNLYRNMWRVIWLLLINSLSEVAITLNLWYWCFTYHIHFIQ